MRKIALSLLTLAVLAATLFFALGATPTATHAAAHGASVSFHAAVNSAMLASKCPSHSKQITIIPCRVIQLTDPDFTAFFELTGHNLPIGMDMVITSDDLVNGCSEVLALNSETGVTLDGAVVTVDHTHRFGILVEAVNCNEDTYHISFCEVTAPRHCFHGDVEIEAPHE